MSTSLASKPPTMAQRAATAGEKAVQITRLSDATRLKAAILEIANEELERNPGFLLKVRARYEELASKKPTTVEKKPRTPKQATSRLVPIKQVDELEINPAAMLDPYLLLEVYGPAQFAEALREQSKANLQEAIALVQERHPGTSPKSMGSKAPLIAYIMEYVLPR